MMPHSTPHAPVESVAPEKNVMDWSKTQVKTFLLGSLDGYFRYGAGGRRHGTFV